MSDKEKKPTTKRTTTKTAVDNTKKAYCYIGPNTPGGALKQNAVVLGTREAISEKYKEELEKYPQIEKLIVPVERLANAKTRVKTPGNIINKHYQDLVSAINAEREV